MSTEVASTEYGVIIHNDEWNTLELKWLPTTKDATEEQARATMALFAAETEKLKPRFLIVDTTEFLHRWAEPKDHGREIRAYLRDPDGHLIEVGQITGVLD